MNPFDAVVAGFVLIGIVIGYMSGLLRSLATILGYLVAAPLAVALTARLTGYLPGKAAASPVELWMILFAVFLVLGLAVSALLRVLVSEFVGPETGSFDRIAGAVLGAVRIILVAVLIVICFDRLIPQDREPAFLVGSKLRPYLSAAGRNGLRSLPPEIETYIDRLKRERGI